jgi:predicted transcriptional regulator
MPRRAKPLLTKLELEVMRAIWEAEPDELSVREVVERLNARPGRSFAYTTIQTMMTILKRKGVLASRVGEGRAHSWRARVSRDEVTSSMVGDLVERLFDGNARPLLARLVENDSLERGELEELRRMIDRELDDEEAKS